MDSLLIGSNILEVKTESITFVIKSKVNRKSVSSEPLSYINIQSPELISVSINGEEREIEKANNSISFETIPLFFEQTDYEIIVKSENGEDLIVDHDSALIRGKITPVFKEKDLLSGVINFDNNLGFSDFSVFTQSGKKFELRIEVYPTKISYKEDYQLMLQDISDEIDNLVFDFLRKTFQLTSLDRNVERTPAIFYQIISQIFENYLKAVRKIISNPNHKLIKEYQILPAWKVKRTDVSSLGWTEKHPETVTKINGSNVPEKMLNVKKVITNDTVENQLAKHILKQTILWLKDFASRYEKINKDEFILQNVERMLKQLNQILSGDFFSEISEFKKTCSMSLVFQMAPGYRDLYKYYIMLRSGLSLNGDVFKLSTKDTGQLYEYWCFIKLVQILKNKYKLQTKDVFKVDRSGITVRLVKGQKSTVSFINPKTDELISLIYNPGEQRTQTVNQKPDNVLSLEKKGSKIQYKYIFDAKYRVQTEQDQSYQYAVPGPKLEDINTMHRYRDSIVYETPLSVGHFPFEKTMFGAYVLFPISDEESYINHDFYKSIESVNIGGLPFLPGATSLVEKLLDTLISESEESAFERASFPIGIEARIKEVNWGRKEVLVGGVRTPEQLDINRNNNFYHVKESFVINHYPIEYIAIYQSVNQFGSQNGLRWVGKVKEISTGKRIDLVPEIKPRPGTETDKYVRFEIEEWKCLEKEIKYSDRESTIVAPRFTNLFLLQNSSTMYELFSIHSEEEYRLLSELKRYLSNDVTNKDAEIKISDSVVIKNENQSFNIIKNGQKIKSISFKDFNRHPRVNFEEIKKML